MKIGYILLAALIIALVVAYFTWDSVNATEITAQALAKEYTSNMEAANKKYLNKVLDIEGNVKAYYMMLGARPVLELETGEGNVPVFFFFLDQETETEAGQLQSEQKVVIRGRCVGENEYSFVNGLKIEVEKIVEK
ncbi:MAG: hypothetical protein R6W90_17695 [Ignavibacteriaceae bacterium]